MTLYKAIYFDQWLFIFALTLTNSRIHDVYRWKRKPFRCENTAIIRRERPTVLLLYKLSCFDARFINFHIKHAKFVE